MEQYAVYENKGGGKVVYPYLLNIHHPLAEGWGNTVVVPLVPLSKLSGLPPRQLCPLLKIQDQRFVAMTHMLGGVRARDVGKRVKHLDDEIYEVKNAFDFLLNGI